MTLRDEGLSTGCLRTFQACFHCFVIQTNVDIATILSDMDTELAALQARRDKTRALKQGMMQKLLTGRIRSV